MVSRTLRVEGSGEGAIAAPLEGLAKAHPALSLGSYPFYGADGFGSNLVIRGRDPVEVEATLSELITVLREAGIEQLQVVETPA